MSGWWLLPVPILLVGLVATALLARTATRELGRVGDEQARWVALRVALGRIRDQTDALGERRQELGRR